MQQFYRTSALALLMAALAAPAAAQTAGENPCWPALSRFDADRNASLDMKELGPHRTTIFDAIDRNRDGILSREEYASCIASAQGDKDAIDRDFTAFDNDRDKRITRAEFTAAGVADRTQIVLHQRPAQVTVQQAQPTVNVQQAPPTVTVQQAQPTVTVQQPQPTVTVEQPQPKVTVQQAQPKVSVEQAQPRVTVQQAEPKVSVEQAQPKVRVQQADPKVVVEQAQPKVAVEQAQPRAASQQGTAADAARRDVKAVDRDWNTGRPFEMSQIRGSEVIGRDVVNLRGNEVGEVEDLVISKEGKALYAVVSVGGFLGLGEKDVVIPLDQLRMSSDNVILMSRQTEDQLKQMPAYERDRYMKHDR